MKAHVSYFSCVKMASFLGVSLSRYYHFLKKPQSIKALENARLLFQIKVIYEESSNTDDSPRVHTELLAQGGSGSRRRVAHLMREHHIQAKIYKRFKRTTRKSDKPYHRGEDLIRQHFYAPMPNRLGVTDISYIKIKGGFTYLSIILDLFSKIK